MNSDKGKTNIQLGSVILILLDIVAFMISLSVADIYMSKGIFFGFLKEHIDFFILMIVITIANFYFFDLYYTLKDFRRFRQTINFFLAVTFSTILVSTISFWDRSFLVPRKFIVISFAIFFVLGLTTRIIFSILKRPICNRRAIIIGITGCEKEIVEYISKMGKKGKRLGIDIVGYIADRPAEEHHLPHVRYLGAPEEIDGILEMTNADLLIYSALSERSSGVKEKIIKEKLRGINLISSVALFSAISGQVGYEYLDDSWLIEECLRGSKFSQVRLKRMVDIILGFLFLILFFPLIVICAILIKLESKGPVFFIQDRIGRAGKTFKMIKLRSMTQGRSQGEQDPEGWHKKNLGRITHIGKFLRKTHIDEIPQFINVLKGDMSIVGPRPEMEMFIRHCEKKIPFYRLRLAVRPGITGWAQIWYSHTSTFSGYKKKFRYDLFYLANLSLKLDLEIMVRTILRVMGYPKEQKFMEGK